MMIPEPSPICRRCHRALKDAASIKRGYGPVCWAKVRPKDGEDEQLLEPCTISYPGLAEWVRKNIWERILQGKIQTCSCGEPLEYGELASYDHDGGYHLKGYGKPQWVYLQCPKCGYQWSIWKLRIDLEDLEKPKKLEPKVPKQATLPGVEA